jgi:hypothetical protein
MSFVQSLFAFFANVFFSYRLHCNECFLSFQLRKYVPSPAHTAVRSTLIFCLNCNTISVKKKMTQPPSAIPATIKHNNVEKGQVISRAAVQSFNTSRIVQCWAMNGDHGHVILNLAR